MWPVRTLKHSSEPSYLGRSRSRHKRTVVTSKSSYIHGVILSNKAQSVAPRAVNSRERPSKSARLETDSIQLRLPGGQSLSTLEFSVMSNQPPPDTEGDTLQQVIATQYWQMDLSPSYTNEDYRLITVNDGSRECLAVLVTEERFARINRIGNERRRVALKAKLVDAANTDVLVIEMDVEGLENRIEYLKDTKTTEQTFARSYGAAVVKATRRRIPKRYAESRL